MPDNQIPLTLEQVAQLTGQNPEAITQSISTDDGGVDPAKAFDYLSSAFKAKIKKAGDDRYQIGWKASRQAVETVIKDKFGVTDFENAEQAIELAAALLEESRTAGKTKFDPANLTVEQLSKLPAFEQATTQLRQAMEQAAQERARAEQDLVSYKTMNVVESKTRGYLKSKSAHYGAIGEDDALGLFFTSLTAKGYNLALDESKNPILLDREGKQIVDEYHTPVKYEEVIDKLWPFGFNTAPAGGNPNAPDKNAGAASASSGGTANKYGAWTIESLKAAVNDSGTPTTELPLMFRALADKQANAK